VKTAWLWTYARDDRPFGSIGPPMVAYRFEDSRGGECPTRHLAGFSGLLQSDGYGAYRQLAAPGRAGGPVTLAACWAHLRRRFYELHAAALSETATWTIERMAALWGLEQQIRGRGPEDRRAARRQAAAPIVAALFARWEDELTRVPGKSKLAEAIRYASTRRVELERFLHDGRLDIDNNTVERAIRPQTMRGSLCKPFSSVCKHWKRAFVGSATRATLSSNRSFHSICRQIGCADLEGRTRHNLHSGKDIRLDQAPDGVVRHAKRLGGFRHGEPFSTLFGGQIGVNASDTAHRAHAFGRPGFALASGNAHPVERGGDVLIRPAARHAAHHR
jgi:Transposase IS66 family